MKSNIIVNPTGSLKSRMHSKLAMRAAKRMSRTRSKQKTGRKVIHHLKMMLELQDPSRKRFSEALNSASNQNLLLFPDIRKN
ncbi:MAG: hypothetical protein CBD40_03530 [Gammaproteobacteria bacterium TMED180]|nr:MAG: hypothetical protein CBD40_03530 [Gammaproteobacteria bacterium TMED180]